MKRWLPLCLVCLAVSTLLAAAPRRPIANWGGWRGPERTGVSAETGLARSWPEGGPALLWTARGVGEGYSTPSVVGRALFVMGNKDGQEWVFALDTTKDGAIVWQTPLGEIRGNGGGYPGPRSTPTVDGKFVYTLGLNGDLVCLNGKDGSVVWKHDLVGEFGGRSGGWGYTESVLIDGDVLVCTPGGDQATLLALNKSTGEPIWAAPLGDGAGYASPIRAEIAGVPQYIQFTSQGVVAVHAENGELLWRYQRPANGTANCSTPIASGDYVFAASGYGTGGGLVQVSSNGGSLTAEEVYFTGDMKNHHGGMLLIDGCLYGSDDPGILTCLDYETGDIRWKAREPEKCSLIAADGLIVARSEGGRVSLVEATPDEFRLLGQFDQPERSGNPAWPHPVVADGKLYLRDQDVLLCYDLTETGE